MDDATIFDEAIRHLGGRMNRLPRSGEAWKSCYGHIENWANELISSARSFNPRLPEIHFDFVRNGDVNAYAFRRKRRYFIGVTTGTRFMLELVLGRMLADSTVLPFISDSSAESSNLPPLAGYKPNGEAMYQAGKQLCVPRTPSRQAYMIHTISQAMLFLIGHEIAHISRGHVDYQESRHGSAFIAEMTNQNSFGNKAIERQTLEMDADARSVISRISSAMSNFEAGAAPPWLTVQPAPAHFMFDTIFAISCFFRLFGDKRFTSDDLKYDSYPPLAVRQGIAKAIALGFVQSSWDEALKDNATKAFRLATMSTELSYATILGEPLPVDGLSEAGGEAGKNHWLTLLEHWEMTFKDKLRSFAYEPLV